MPKETTTTEKTAIERPPVICIMGHIDHGKSTLLDYIRKTNIVDTEAGGITQHISAYEVEYAGTSGAKKRITFIDTPGHEAFSNMRKCGTEAADIAVLVVSAEDGVKPQTVEAYKCIEAAGTPFVVAITKIDKPSANVEKVKISLAEAGIYLEGYGGSVSYVPISAKTGAGIPELLDILLLTAEVTGLTGDPSELGSGVVIETERDAKKGISAMAVIKDGTVKMGQYVSCGAAYSPIRIAENFAGKKITEATFSSPIRIFGWNQAPEVGATWRTFEKKRDLEDYLETREKAAAAKPVSEDNPENKKIVPILIKADTLGSTEAIAHELRKVSHERIALKTVHSGIGDVTESDVKLIAGAKDALVVAFNVSTDAQAEAMLDRLAVERATFNIIYKITEWVDEKLKERTPKVQVDEILGKAKILKFFSRAKDRQIIGGKVMDREISVGHKVKISRREAVIGEGVIRELQQTKVRTQSVASGFEFGAAIESVIELAPGDVIEDFITVEK
ncbi:MAG: translation initiation factor IF-2 [Candidatus Paceibacterota bacterium]|jgi:translation initiation factor IF-2